MMKAMLVPLSLLCLPLASACGACPPEGNVNGDRPSCIPHIPHGTPGAHARVDHGPTPESAALMAWVAEMAEMAESGVGHGRLAAWPPGHFTARSGCGWGLSKAEFIKCYMKRIITSPDTTKDFDTKMIIEKGRVPEEEEREEEAARSGCGWWYCPETTRDFDTKMIIEKGRVPEEEEREEEEEEQRRQ